MNHEAIVIGGGLAGATLAGRLAHAGREVLLLERSSGPQDKVCGDFLSGEALHYLALSGTDLGRMGAVPLTDVRIARREVLAEARLPFPAMSLRRRVLDEALLQQAGHEGAIIHRGMRVQSLSMENGRHLAKLGDETLSASSIFLATGKHDLHGMPRKGGWQNNLVGLKMYFRLSPAQQEAISGAIELILFPGGYGGLQPVDGGLANYCLLVTRQQFRRLGADWATLLGYMCEHSPHLATRLAGATQMLARPLALSSIPYGFLAPPPEENVWPLGDQSAVIPSFSGDGMSIALHSAHLAASMYLEGRPSAEFTARMRQQVGSGVTLATAIAQLLVRVPAAASVTRWCPSLLRLIATATRVPQSALVR